MKPDKENHPTGAPQRLRRPPSYGQCLRVLERLERFQDLVRRREGWAPDYGVGRSLEELIPEAAASPIQAHRLIERELNRLAWPISNDLDLLGIRTMVRWGQGKDAKTVDLIEDYVAGRHAIDDSGQRFYELLMIALEQGMGAYQAMMALAARERKNPLVWLAWMIRAPIFVLERAGLAEESTHSKVAEIYFWFLKGALLLVVILVAARLGISIKALLPQLKF